MKNSHLLYIIQWFEYLCLMLRQTCKWLIPAIFSLSGISHAQDLAINLTGGVLNYQGDLRQEVYTFQGVRLGYGAGISYAVTSQLGIGVHFSQGRIAADDRNNSDPGLFYRNLNFTTNVSEISLNATIHLLDPLRMRISPYVTGGLAYFRFNPFSHDQSGEKVFLQPLGTEGQGLPGYPLKPYQLNQFCIPFGGGLSIRMNDKVSLAWEVVFRRTGTDHLDDVSTVYANQVDLLIGRGPRSVAMAFRGDELPGTNPVFPNGYPDGGKRGNPTANDWYYFSGLKLTFRLPSADRMSFGPTGKNRTDCPRW